MAIEPKKINFDVAIKSTNHTRAYSLPPEVFTSDTAVQFRFNILDVEAEEFTEGAAVSTVEITTRDGSFFQHVGETSLEGTTVVYDLKEAEGKHAGLAKIQLKINLGGAYFTSDEYEFKILNTSSNGVPVEIYVQNWETLTAQANAYLTKMAADIEDFDVALETGVLATNITAKLIELQTTYAPDLLSLKQRLEQNTEKIYSKNYVRSEKVLKNVVSFCLDDGPIQDFTMALPISIAENVPFTTNCIVKPPGNPSNFMTIEQIKTLQNTYGWEINSHTMTHPNLSTLSVTQLDYEFGQSKAYFEGNGIKVESLCYPMGLYNQLVRDIARKYYRAGFASIQDINKSPIYTYRVMRLLIDEYDIATLMQKIDSLNNQWLILYTHTATWTQANVDKFTQAIQYVKSKNIAIMTVSKALDVYENMFEAGDGYEANTVLNSKQQYFKIGADGRTESSNLVYTNLGVGTGITKDTPISSFQKNKISVTQFLSGESNFPFTHGIGTLKTYRLHLNEMLNYQEFHAWDNSLIAKRRWNNVASTSGAWDVWNVWSNDATQTPALLDKRIIKNGTPITSFPALKVSYVSFSSGDSDFPFSSSIGTLTTFRLSLSDNLSYQIFQEYGTAISHVRNWLGSGVWGAWYDVTPVSLSVSKASGVPELPANSTVVVNVPIAGLIVGRHHTCSFSTLPDGVLVTTSITVNDSLVIKYTNTTSAYIRGIGVVNLRLLQY